MRKVLLLAFLSLMVSCSLLRLSDSNLKEDELLYTRKYIGNFVEYHHTAPDISGGTNLVWIKTTLFPAFGQLSVYGRNCEFSPGDQLYLRSRYSTDGSFGNWEYLVENEYSVSYRLSEFRNEDKVLVQSLF
jgi:hypothetical protein